MNGDEKVKVLPCDSYLNKYFSDVSLAHAIMGDGYWENDSNTVFICTENFSTDEIDRFIVFLASKFGLLATTKLRNGKYRVRFSSAGDNLITLRKLVKPHMHELMLYKLGK